MITSDKIKLEEAARGSGWSIRGLSIVSTADASDAVVLVPAAKHNSKKSCICFVNAEAAYKWLKEN